MKDKCIKIFEDYISKFNLNNEKNAWKYKHSYRVAKIMEKLAINESISPGDYDFAYVIGLYHDIGRFLQIEKYDSYNDLETIDHGDIGYNYLKDSKVLNDILTDEQLDILLLCVKFHNKKSIPVSYSGIYTKFMKMIRDADKIDILRGIAEKQISSETCKDPITEEVRDSFFNKEITDRKIIKNENDVMVINFSFVFDLNFKTTRNILIKDDTFNKIYNILENPEYFTKINEFTNKCLKEGI